MKYIICATNRPNSRSMIISQKVKSLYDDMGEETEIIDLSKLSMNELDGGQYGGDKPDALQKTCDKLLKSQGMIFVIPEYNGSYPGIVKYFIDHWAFPDTFEFRPMCFIGLGGQYAALRPVEHLQQVMGYRNAFLYPKRVFIANVWSAIDKSGEIVSEDLIPRLSSQAKGFVKFIKALETEGLDANTYLANKE